VRWQISPKNRASKRTGASPLLNWGEPGSYSKGDGFGIAGLMPIRPTPKEGMRVCPYFYLLLVYHRSATGAMQAEGVGGGERCDAQSATSSSPPPKEDEVGAHEQSKGPGYRTRRSPYGLTVRSA
jgi:hypothetical protein